MADQRIVDYIKRMLASGYPTEQIRNALLQQGWFEEEIQEAFAQAKAPQTPPALPKPALPSAQPAQPAGPAQPVQPSAQPGKEAALGIKEVIKPSFVLSIIGGSLIMVNALMLFLGFGDLLPMLVSDVEFSPLGMLSLTFNEFEVYIIGFIVGVGILIGSVLVFLRPEKSNTIGVLVLVLSAMTLMIGNGFIIGAVPALLAGIAGIIKR